MKKLIVIVSLIVFGCQQGGGPITQADKDAIKKNMDAFASAILAESDEIGNSYTDDIISMPPHGQEISGKQNVVAFHKDPVGPKTTSFTINPNEIEGSGNLAYVRGTWSFSGVMNDTLSVNDNGKFLVIMKKQADNSWKTSRETWNSNQPMPGM